jgi:carboxyl-terminal processing protease
MKRFVLDLRGNGGGLMSEAVNIISLFVPKGSLAVSSKGLTEDTRREYKTSTEPIDTKTPMIIMIDGGSASASEIVSGGLQDLKRATIMGKTSFGKGLVQSIRPLPYNGQMKITTAKYYTPSGRCVQGIGVTPDVEIDVPTYSRLVYSLVLGGVIDQYVLRFARQHDSIPAVEDYHFSDADFEDFIDFAKTQDFDYRSSAKATFDKMKKELEEDGLAEVMSSELSALEKALEMDKERFIRLKKDEIIPFIEEEIATRYHFQEAGVKIRLRYDKQLKAAL